jgi:hypothetical protein
MALAGALLVLGPAFTLPPRYPAASAPVPPQPLPDAHFGDAIAALGYEVSPRSLEPGRALKVTLFLQPTRTITEDHALALQLLSPVHGDDVTLVNLNTLPGGGTHPTYAWERDEVIVDQYRLQIPAQVERAQAWRVMAIVYRLTDGKRLPVTVAGQPAGKMLGLGLVRVGAGASTGLSVRALEVPPEARLESGPLFGETIWLEGVRLVPDGDHLRVQTWWRAGDHVLEDYVTLVHLYDAEGALLAAGDARPLQGAFPTALWEPGDLVADEYILPDDGRGMRVGLGWYDPVSGVRLPVLDGGELLGDSVYEIPLSP